MAWASLSRTSTIQRVRRSRFFPCGAGLGPFSLASIPEFPINGAGTNAVPLSWVAECSMKTMSRRQRGFEALFDAQFESRSWPPSNERVRSRAVRSAWPSRTRLKARSPTGREQAKVDLVGRAGAEAGVRPLRIVPRDIVVDLASERCSRQGNDGQKPRAFVLQRTDEPLDHCEATVVLHRKHDAKPKAFRGLK